MTSSPQGPSQGARGKRLRKKLARPLEKLLIRLVDERIERLLEEDSYNLRRALQRQAAEESANWIKDHVPLHLQFEDRLSLLEHSAKMTKTSTGLCLEFGVYSGTTINFVAKLLPETTLYGFDSFKGLNEPWIYRGAGAFGDIDSLPNVRANVVLVEGLFEEKLPAFLSAHQGSIAFLHIDSDLYSSAKTVLEMTCARFQRGTIIVFDEYFNYPAWKTGEHKAWTEAVKHWNLEFEYLGYCWRHKWNRPGGQQLALRITATGPAPDRREEKR